MLRFSAVHGFSEISCNGQPPFISKTLGACKARTSNSSVQDQRNRRNLTYGGLTMKRKSVVALTFVFALAFALVLLIVPVQAQQSCKAFHAFVQGSLPTSNQFAPTDTWGGPIFVNLGGDFLQGGLSGNDGTEHPHGPVSIFKGGQYKLCLTSAAAWGGPNDCSDSFTYEVPRAVVIWPAGKLLGSYKATANVANGTGRFASASGQLEIEGPFILWTDPNSPFGVSGRWNGEFKGRVCGVQ
jgi:hypothetical protein